MGALWPSLILLPHVFLLVHHCIVIAKFLEAGGLVYLLPEGDLFILVEVVDELFGTVYDWTLAITIFFEVVIALFCRFFKACQAFLSECLHLF